MSNDTLPKGKLKVIGKNIIVYSDRTPKEGSKIIVPDLQTYKDHTKWKYDNCSIYALGDGIDKDYPIGAKVILDPLTKVRHFEVITKEIEKLTGKKMKEDKDAGKQEGYFACKEEDIIVIINN